MDLVRDVRSVPERHVTGAAQKGKAMRLLQVNNVGTLLGGTGACGYSIRQALPDWQHTVVFLSKVDDFTRQQFGCDVRSESRITPQLIDEVKPDVVLFHNTAANRMPSHIPGEVLTVYYQHSAALACREARRKCDLFLTVSQHLAKLAGIDSDLVLYQPVPCPPNSTGTTRNTAAFGRICTPNGGKWEGQNEFYASLSSAVDALSLVRGPLPKLQADFVGAPDAFLPSARDMGRFIPASWEARSLLREWSAMLYHHPTITETYGRTVCEAQRAGCIPIVDARGGFVEQVEHGKTGFLCSSVNDFADALYRVMSGKHEINRQRMAESAAARGSLSVWRRNFLRWVEAAASVKA